MQKNDHLVLQEKYLELEKKVKELSISNKELEQFAYMASHDLQEPLRMISSFLQLLEKKYKDKIDEEGSAYIRFAVDGANRMKQLIQDMLEYSKAGNSAKELGNTDMNEVVLEVLNIFGNKIEELRAKIHVSSLPILPNTSKSQMLQLMLNLVSNALKYIANKAPLIEITARKREQHWLFCIKDNGIGIDPLFADKIFVIFQRLHSRKEYSGTGIGLAVAKKIVEKYGGNIWVESEQGKGSAFYFTFPQ